MPTYSVCLLVLTELNQDGSAKTTDPKTLKVTTPQQVSFDPQIVEGQKQELRGGGKRIATVVEPDELTGINATLQNAVLKIEEMAMIGGGTITGTAPSQGYSAPKLGDPTPAPFKAEIYSPIYEEGEHHESDIKGYMKVTLWNCKGRVPSWVQQDRNFVIPSYTIKGLENTAQSKPSFEIDFVDALTA